MFAHRRGHCALCLPHATLLQRTPPRNSPSRSFCSCVLPTTPSGAQFHHVFMKTSAKHRVRSPMPPRSFLLLSSWRVAISPVLSHRVHNPALPYSWTLLRRLLHTVLLMMMRPPNSRLRSSFPGASTSKILWIARSHHRHMDLPTAPHFSNPVTSPTSTVSAVPAAPADLMLVHRFHERGSTLHHRRHQVSKDRHSWEFHTTSLRIKPPCAPHL